MYDFGVVDGDFKRCALETKKGPEGPFFVGLRSYPQARNLERETRLELATSTLARLRSTN